MVIKKDFPKIQTYVTTVQLVERWGEGCVHDPSFRKYKVCLIQHNAIVKSHAILLNEIKILVKYSKNAQFLITNVHYIANPFSVW